MGGRGKSSGVQHQLTMQEQMLKAEVSQIINSRTPTIEADENGGFTRNSSTESGSTQAYDNRVCACCGTYSIPYSSDLFICPICGWIDDIFQNFHPDSTDGPNACSLSKMKEKIRKRLI